MSSGQGLISIFNAQFVKEGTSLTTIQFQKRFFIMKQSTILLRSIFLFFSMLYAVFKIIIVMYINIVIEL